MAPEPGDPGPTDHVRDVFGCRVSTTLCSNTPMKGDVSIVMIGGGSYANGEADGADPPPRRKRTKCPRHPRVEERTTFAFLANEPPARSL